MAAKISEPVGSWWGAFDNGEVWPVEVLSTNIFGTRVRATHDAAPQGEHVLHPQRVYDSNFNRPKKVYSEEAQNGNG
jgi:hypothetical protein